MTDKVRKDAHQPEGSSALRESIAAHLLRTRGIRTDASRIVIVNGSMQAIALLTQLLVGPGDRAVTETPGYEGIRHAIRAAGAELIEAPVDEAGICIAPWQAKIVFITPNRQYPTGAVLTMERRQALLRYAAENHAYLIEDDYDSEFRHQGRPLEPLKSLDMLDRVAFVGTFSKTMMSDLRIGYIVLPSMLVAPFCLAKRLYEPHPSSILEQRALARFMNSGAYERHLRRMKRVYSRKFILLRQALNRSAIPVRWVEGDAGLHIFGWWYGSKLKYSKFEEACKQAGVTWVRADEEGPEIGLIIGFSNLTEREIEDGIETMRKIWETMEIES